MGRTIFQDGMTFHESLTGGYQPELTLLGNPKMSLDFWGNPKIATDSWGNQIVEVDMLGNPRIPVAYPTINDVARHSGGSASAGGGAGVVLSLLPVVLLAGGLYSVFATMAGAFILVVGLAGLVGVGLATLIADKASSVKLSNGIQPAVYIFTVGWVSGITSFWINFFFKMNFDVSNTNYLTWDSILSVVLPQMGLAAAGGVALASLFVLVCRSDLYHVRKVAKSRKNRVCVGDIAAATFVPPVLAVVVSLLWVLIIAPIAALAMKKPWSPIAHQQSTVMAICFVILAAAIIVARSVQMVRK